MQPLVKQCRTEIEAFKRDNGDVKEAILSFDRTLATKADRINIFEVRKWCEESFLKADTIERFREEFGEAVSTHQKTADEVVKKLRQFEENRREFLGDIVKSELAIRMRKYDKVHKEFSRFFETPVLQDVLDAKVDQTHLSDCFTKRNQEQTEVW